MDIANINRVIEKVKAEPKLYKMTDWVNFDMNKYYASQDALEAMAEGNTCGTAACLGGWMNILAIADKRAGDPRYADISEGQSTRLVGAFLGSGSTYGLFNMANKSGEYLSMPHFDKLPAEDRARAGVRVLEIFRDTGKSDAWAQALRETGLYEQVVIRYE